MMVVGIDESGRGCVIGPLVICAYAIEEEKQKELRKKGVKDSKLLEPSTRKKLAKELSKGVFALKKISAEELTQAMNKKISLNELEAIKAAEALEEISGKTSFKKAFVDSPDPIPIKFEKRIRKYFKKKCEIISENYADRKYPVVSAASIIAKVERDAEVEKIKKIVEYDFGTGYSSDPLTIDFLKKHLKEKKLQEFLRHKWETVKRLRTHQIKLSHYF